MKKIILLAVSMLFACVAANAQDIILKTDNSIITALIQEINENEIIYKDFSNQAGPIFKVSIQNVQKVKFANGSEQVFNNAPQAVEATPVPQQNSAPARTAVPAAGSVNNYGPNYPAYSRYDLYNKSDEQLKYILGEDAYSTYCSARRQASAGGTIWGLGLGLAVGGLIPMAVGLGTNEAAAVSVGSIFFSIGNLLLAVGVPIYCVGNARLKWVYNDYEKNGGRAATLSLGETSNGYGLKICF